ncbi:hypothetical protein FW774_17575 [Pedobacter sp. BS3]|uniref:FKBP-type peptidyl-prolyl cis-trans isomerase n=1 Tax=Pedobacter sp. BS3 TaxID=2567937 RepID=UPI0011ECEBB5|nr:FKBP-type peptidyl-prolyl cis-trans isomerase [Pedobacter sp. BS3]TZF81860.1 hypothetical protein FW774_17575 [Pedobacter sp. BS3]
MKLHHLFLLLGLGLLAFSSCKKEYESIEQYDERQIQSYIKANNLTGMTPYNDTGIYSKIITPGTGSEMDYTEQVPLVYTMKTLDGSYSSTDTIVNHYGNYLGYFGITGLREGVKEVLKNRGGEIRLLIPSRLAYGRNGSGSIPGNASLDVTVKALDIAGLDEYEDQMIKKYMDANGLTSSYTKTADGIYYRVVEMGSGSPITADSVITATYVGKLLNGTYFDGSATASSTLTSYTLNTLADCWVNILPLVKEGSTVRFISPSKYGYGLTGSGAVPAFSPLYFDVKVTDVASE